MKLYRCPKCGLLYARTDDQTFLGAQWCNNYHGALRPDITLQPFEINDPIRTSDNRR